MNVRLKRPLVSHDAVLAAKSYDYRHKPYGNWQSTDDAQTERIITGFLLWLADTLKENAP
jgi:hypothetical protein